MAGFRKALLGAAFVTMTVILGGCESMDSAMQDVKNRFSSLDLSLPEIHSENRSFAGINEAPPQETAAEETSPRTAAAEQGLEQIAGNCPPVTIVEELNALHQFENPEKPSPATRISSVTLSGLKTACAYNQNNIVIDMELRFDGEVGPRARVWNTDRPTFAYPYFMAIATQNGNISAKEVFAATISYNKEQDQQTHTENLRQIIPLSPDSNGGYAILIGFQLTEEELAYNRALKNTSPHAEAMPAPAVEKPLLITPPHKPEMPASVTREVVSPPAVEETSAASAEEESLPESQEEAVPAEDESPALKNETAPSEPLNIMTEDLPGDAEPQPHPTPPKESTVE